MDRTGAAQAPGVQSDESLAGEIPISQALGEALLNDLVPAPDRDPALNGLEDQIVVFAHEPGKKKTWMDGWAVQGGRIAGTYVHGILDSSGFRGEFLNSLRRKKGLKERPPKQGRLARFHQYDRLADHFEEHCDVDRIITLCHI